jgi:hypothetical protein
VQTKPHFLTSEAQAHRYVGTAAKTLLVPGTVLAVEIDSSGTRARTSVDVQWELPGRYLTKSVPIRSVTFIGRPDSNLVPSAGATTTPAPAIAGTVDEDSARRQEKTSTYSWQDGPSRHLNRLLMSLLSRLGSSGIRKVFWGILEVWFHGGRSLCVLSPAILPWKEAMPYVGVTLVRLTTSLRRCSRRTRLYA